MATRVTTTTVDDFTGEPGASTFTFSFGNQDYEIDLVKSDPLLAALKPFMDAGRKTSRRRSTRSGNPGGGSAMSGADRDENMQIRAWAMANEIPVPSRGRIPERIRAAYEAKDPRLALAA